MKVLDASRAGMEDTKREHRTEFKKLSEDLEKSNTALMQKELSEVQLQEKVARLECDLHDLEEASNKKFRAAESDEEIAVLREEMLMMETEAREGKFDRDELSNRLARVELDCQVLDEQLSARDEEIKLMTKLGVEPKEPGLFPCFADTMYYCWYCKSSPCKAPDIEYKLQDAIECGNIWEDCPMPCQVPIRKANYRYACYRFVTSWFGGNWRICNNNGRREIPKCVREMIMKMFPEMEGE